MVLVEYPNTYSVVRLAPDSQVPAWAYQGSFTSVTRTPMEISVICQERNVPPEQSIAGGWFLIGCQGPLDFSSVGILGKLTAILMEAELPILAISTYDTDYILTRNLSATRKALQKAGYEIVRLAFSET